MIWYFLLTGSILVNLFFVWYIRELLIRFNKISNTTNYFFSAMQEYEEHLTSVYELPVFYGDSTLEGLIRHTKDIKEEVQVYKDLFDIDDEQVLPVEEEAEDG
tara:strand:+ start:1562 stop:1870 length:309 start_codon:yes stop_codon:yes gene_type:complete